MQTANDRLKGRWTTWYSRGIVLAVAVHLAILVTWPTMTAADMSVAREEMMLIVPPELDVPPPPEVLARPATPIVSETTIDENITIPSITEDVWRAEKLTPPAATRSSASEEYRTFVPSMLAPRVLNQAEVERALERNYPETLRNAGIGGRVQVNIWLDEKGIVTRAAVARTSGQAQLDAAALEVIDVMRFSPAMNMGLPARVIVEIPILFHVR